MKTLLVTGFEPFGGERVNPSWECAKAMPDEINGVRVVTARLPVSWARIGGALNALIDAMRPDAVLLLGQAGGRREITIERIAMNLRDAASPDNEGVIKQNEPVVDGGPDGLFATLPCYEMRDALLSTNIPAAFSYSAGPYLCNSAMYLALHRAKTDRPRMRAGFVHLPYMKGQNESAFAMELSDMIKGVALCCEQICLKL